jgi:hypothetical protein
VRYYPSVSLYFFRSIKDMSLTAVTYDHLGGNLPSGYALWHPLNGGRPVSTRFSTDPVVEAVVRTGYYLLLSPEITCPERSVH